MMRTADWILIDGSDIRTIPTEILRQKFGVVFQNDFLFADTIEENIRYFRDIPEKEIKQAAETAQAEEFIHTVGGMEYAVSARGNNLSGGQKQRLLIARALGGTSGNSDFGRFFLSAGLPYGCGPAAGAGAASCRNDLYHCGTADQFH